MNHLGKALMVELMAQRGLLGGLQRVTDFGEDLLFCYLDGGWDSNLVAGTEGPVFSELFALLARSTRGSIWGIDRKSGD